MTPPYYLKSAFDSVTVEEPTPGAGLTVDGYTVKRGAPTRYKVTLQGERRLRRVMVWCFSNCGTLFVRVNGRPLLLTPEHEYQLEKWNSNK